MDYTSKPVYPTIKERVDAYKTHGANAIQIMGRMAFDKMKEYFTKINTSDYTFHFGVVVTLRKNDPLEMTGEIIDCIQERDVIVNFMTYDQDKIVFEYAGWINVRNREKFHIGEKITPSLRPFQLSDLTLKKENGHLNMKNIEEKIIDRLKIVYITPPSSYSELSIDVCEALINIRITLLQKLNRIVGQKFDLKSVDFRRNLTKVTDYVRSIIEIAKKMIPSGIEQYSEKIISESILLDEVSYWLFLTMFKNSDTQRMNLEKERDFIVFKMRRCELIYEDGNISLETQVNEQMDELKSNINVPFRRMISDSNIEKTLLEKIRSCGIVSAHLYEVPWTYVLKCVGAREVCLNNGMAYINTNDFVCHFIWSALYLPRLSDRRKSERIEEMKRDELYESIFKIANKIDQKNSKQQKSTKRELGIVDIEDCIKSAPLCLKHIIKKMPGIKHMQRVLLTGYFVDMGINSEEITQEIKKLSGSEYKNHFSDGSAKRKALIGRSNYTASCTTIATWNVSAKGGAGCPYVFMDDKTLVETLRNHGASNDTVIKIMKEKKSAYFSNVKCCEIFGGFYTEGKRQVNNPMDYANIKIAFEKKAKTSS